jgi:hypothetical protein
VEAVGSNREAIKKDNSKIIMSWPEAAYQLKVLARTDKSSMITEEIKIYSGFSTLKITLL